MNKSNMRQCLLFASLIVLCCLADTVRAATDPPQVREIRVVARRYAFEPKTITVRKGERIRLLVSSEDADHGFAIEELNISRDVGKGRDAAIEFTPTREGKFRYHCSVFCGEGHDRMTGELIVTGADSTASNIQVQFDSNTPGVVIVESGGERLRIDTNTKMVSRLAEPAGRTESASPAAEAVETSERIVVEPYDYRLVNVPTPKRVPKGSFNVHFTHRFSKPVHQENESFGETFEELFGLDSFAVSSLGFSYGFTDRLYGSFYRSPICQPAALCKTIELGLGFRLLDEAGKSPIALTAYASIEGADNFSENFTFNVQAMMARSVTRYVNLFFSPAVHFNTNGQGQFNPRPESFFPPSPLASQLELGQHTGSFGFGVNASILPSMSLLFEYVPRVGFKLGQVEPILDSQFNLVGLRNKSEASLGFGIEKRIGRHAFALTFSNTQTTTTSRYNSSNLVLPPSRIIIGFNLFRRLM